jgi:quercetin dioxygenase-like cupin family protein
MAKASTTLRRAEVPAPAPQNPAAKPKASAKAEAAARKPQRFVASHPSASSFVEGLRSYAAYRDLGIAAATDGMVQAQVIRFIPPCRPEEVSKLHYHDVEFQMVYVLKGWIKSEFEGQGVQTFKAGACWIQPPRIKHKVLDYSDDCEVLEIILPAEFDTVTLD